MSLKDIKLKKSLGQHILTDQNILSKIIKESSLNKNDYVLEIGAGLGHLTTKLAPLVKKLIAVEIDKSIFQHLEQNVKGYSNLELVCADILRLDLNDVLAPKTASWKIIANIPYYITSPIITYLIENFINRLDFIVFTMQLDVCQRLTAKPGTKIYGALSVFVQFYTYPEILFEVPRTAFYPPPKVESAVIKLTPKRTLPSNMNQKFLFKIVKIAFSQRRKKLINCLLSGFSISKGEIENALHSSGIDPNRRGETLSLEEFIGLAKSLELLVKNTKN